jgi:hypothetical protein
MNKYNFKYNDVVHSLDVKISQNSKIGFGIVLQTYHFSIEQVENNDFTLDEKNCLDCPYSFNQNDGKSGKCYTHKGMQLMGLLSKLKSLHKQNLQGKIKEFNCPASKESERKKTCVQCGLCDGQVSGKRKKDIYILKH